jgi:hypothetical protein
VLILDLLEEWDLLATSISLVMHPFMLVENLTTSQDSKLMSMHETLKV